jgi:hypothetical protein
VAWLTADETYEDAFELRGKGGVKLSRAGKGVTGESRAAAEHDVEISTEQSRPTGPPLATYQTSCTPPWIPPSMSQSSYYVSLPERSFLTIADVFN